MAVDNRVSTGDPSVLRSISRHWLLVAVVTVVVGLFGLLVYITRATTYVSEVGALLEDPRSAYLLTESSRRDEDRYVADQISILKSPALLVRAGQLSAPKDGSAQVSIRELQKNTSIQTSEGSNYIVIRYSAEDPTTAMIVANSIVEAYKELVRADIESSTAAAVKRLNVAIAEATKAAAAAPGDPAYGLLLQQLRSRRSELEVDAKLAGDGVALFSPAELGRQEGPSLLTALVLAVVLGGLIGVALAYVLDVREARLSRRVQPRVRLRVPLLAEIPDFSQEGFDSKLPMLDAPGSRLADTFRFLAAAVGLRREPFDGSVSAKLAESLHDEIPGMTDRELAVLDQVASRLDRIALEGQKSGGRKGKAKAKDRMVRSVAFVASSPGDGATTVAANTALAAAQAGDRVLMLDGDLWGRGLTQLLLDGEVSSSANGRIRRVGLTDMLLRGPLPEGISLVTETSNGGTLSLIEPGATTLEALNAIRTELIRPGLDATREDFDRVFIDVPSILQLPYAHALVTSCDAVVVVSPYGGDPASIERLFDLLDVLEVRPIGQVLNFAPVQQASRRGLASDVRASAEKLGAYMSLLPGLRARVLSERTSSDTAYDDADDELAGEPSAGQGRV